MSNSDRTNQPSLLNSVRLPARLYPEQAAQILGFQPHDIPLLIKAGLLKPLGGGPRNTIKYFAAVDIESFRQDRKWLDRATRAASRRKIIQVEPQEANHE